MAEPRTLHDEFTERRADRDRRLAALRPRARRLRLTIKSSRGTAYGNFHLQAGTNWEFCPIVCDGLDDLEGWIADLEGELRDEPAPSLARVQDAQEVVNKRRLRDAGAYFEATRSKICEHCGGAEDADGAWTVGPEDSTCWVHKRCHEPFRAERARQLAERGFINGGCQIVKGG